MHKSFVLSWNLYNPILAVYYRPPGKVIISEACVSHSVHRGWGGMMPLPVPMFLLGEGLWCHLLSGPMFLPVRGGVASIGERVSSWGKGSPPRGCPSVLLLLAFWHKWPSATNLHICQEAKKATYDRRALMPEGQYKKTSTRTTPTPPYWHLVAVSFFELSGYFHLLVRNQSPEPHEALWH